MWLDSIRMSRHGGDRPDESSKNAWRARVLADLQAYQAYEAEELELFGGIDEMMLVRYETGLSTDEERARVEQAMRDFPAVRESIELGRELSAEWSENVASPLQGQLPSPRPSTGDSKIASRSDLDARHDASFPPPVEQTQQTSTDFSSASSSPAILPFPERPPSVSLSQAYDSPAAPVPGGASLIHWITGIGIAAAALAIVIPGVNLARNAAHRAQCTFNLKQIAEAAHNYASACGTFPMGNRGYTISSAGSSPPCSEYLGHSAFVFMLPYLEVTNNYNSYNLVLPGYSVFNATAISTQVRTYVCPADTVAELSIPGSTIPAQASYGTSRGLVETMIFNWASPGKTPPDRTGPYADSCNQGLGDGMFGPESSIRVAGVTDGLANTFLFGEMSRFKNEPSGSNFYFNAITGYWRGPPWSRNTPYWPNDHRITGGAYQVPRLNAPPDVDGSVYAACFAGAVHPPDWMRNPACLNLGQFGFRSRHAGASNFAMADGSVKLIQNGIDSQIYRALGTRNGGEVISEGEY